MLRKKKCGNCGNDYRKGGKKFPKYKGGHLNLCPNCAQCLEEPSKVEEYVKRGALSV